MPLEVKKFETVFFRYIMGVCVFAMLAAIGLYAYLGTFSRYLADDYCEAVRVSKSSSPIAAVIERYTAGSWPRATMRYSNLLFVGISELLGKNNMQITISSVVLLWVAGLIWSVHEVRKFLRITWTLRTDIFLGAALGFFSLLQAPNLFQTVYWRSAMMTHFAPLVFGSLLFAFWLKQARRMETQPLSLPVYLIVFFVTFIISGFSEPPATTLVTALPLLMLVFWIWGKSTIKQRYLSLLYCTFAGAFLGLMVMILSPASADAAQERTLNAVEVLGNSFLYSYFFMVDSLKTQPLPIFLSVLTLLTLVWLYGQTKPMTLSPDQIKAVLLIIIAIPFTVWLLIAAGFSPSVYGQSYPVERMRFLARFMMIAAFMLEGALFGLLLQKAQSRPNRALGQWAVTALFIALAVVYPARAALNIYRFDVPEYHKRAEMWDLREAYIIRHAGLGEREIVVPGLSGVYQVKEIDNNPNHWVNTCAARYYGIDLIRAVNMPENVLEYLSE